uniref:Uncharacterized protein n=1 Tax=Fagus sylvatica TaxID=28930 RepID=A0A2N9HY65_FAGSY
MSKRVKRGEVGSRERKGKENDKMKGKGRAGPEVVGPRAGPSCAAHDGHARVPKTAPFHHFKPRIVFSHPDRSSPSPGIPIWTPEGLARKPRQTARQPVCAKILSDPLQLGPRAKTLRQEVHFSYRMQLSDRQELLRSSRNLSQKMTPWHKEHSDGLCSQDHILRTQTRLCARPVPLKSRVFLTRNKLIREPGHVGKKTHSCTTWNSRIAKNLSGPAGIPIGKLPSNGPKTLRWPLFAGPYLTSPSSDFRKSGTLQKFEKKRAGSKTHFFSRTAAFARRVFPARNKLIREPGCVGKIMTPATTWNSRFADSIPPFDRNLHRKECTKTAPTPRLPGAITPSSELRFAQTLYRWKEDVESFPKICRMTHFEFRKTSKTAPENRIKKDTRTEIEEDSRSCWRGRIRLPRGSTTTRAGPSCAAHDGPARGVHGFL